MRTVRAAYTATAQWCIAMVEAAAIEPGDARFSKLLTESEIQLKVCWQKEFAKSHHLSWFTRICQNLLLE